MSRSSYSNELLSKLVGFRDIPGKHHAFPNPYSVDSFLTVCVGAFDQTSAIRRGAVSEVDKGSFQMLEATYLREVWVSECGYDHLTVGQTEEVALCVMEEKEKPDFVKERTWQKVVGIHEGMKLLGIMSVSPLLSESTVPLTVDLIRRVHTALGKSLIDDAGEFRTKDVGAAQTSVVYLSPERVAPRLEALVVFVSNKLRIVAETEVDSKKKLKQAMALAALFFSEFLFIHPFSNGNGRCARLMVNFLLAPFCVVPISLFGSTNKDTYLNLLFESQQRNNHGGLLVLFLHSMFTCAVNIQYLLLSDE